MSVLSTILVFAFASALVGGIPVSKAVHASSDFLDIQYDFESQFYLVSGFQVFLFFIKSMHFFDVNDFDFQIFFQGVANFFDCQGYINISDDCVSVNLEVGDVCYPVLKVVC